VRRKSASVRRSARPSKPGAPVPRFTVTINGRPVEIEGISPNTTLLEWLRTHGYTGTKCGCAEGDCGACAVALVDRDASGKPTYRAFNSCIALVPMFAGREIVTVEGLASGETLHPVQAHMVEQYGSQCGYCTPGFVVSLFEAWYRTDCKDSRQLSDQLSGNLCRCTGYRPIRDAALHALAQRDRENGKPDAFRSRLGSAVRAPAALDYSAGGGRFLRPTSLPELLELLVQSPEARLVAGATEIGVDINKKFLSYPLLISTEGVAELTRIEGRAREWRIGGAATLTSIEEKLGPEYPSLAKMLRVFASRGIRNRATMGGNLATASPIGDSAPLLLAMDARLRLASARGERTLPLSEFFLGYRQTAIEPGEVIVSVILPKPLPAVVRFYKAAKRRMDDISTVAAAFAIGADRRLRIAYGGVAPVPLRAWEAEAAADSGRAREILARTLRPISDHRGSAAYRLALAQNLLDKFRWEEAA